MAIELAGKQCEDVQREISRCMGPEAEVQDWIRFEQVTRSWSVGFKDLFVEWLRSQARGGKVFASRWNETEVEFVRKHVRGKDGASGERSAAGC
jgi:hypothetical protein